MSKLPIDQVICGDAAELSRDKLPDCSIHAIVTDPPYGLEFMGEEWDKFGRARKWDKKNQWWEGTIKGTGFKRLPSYRMPQNPRCKKCGHYKLSGTPCRCENPEWELDDNSYLLNYQKWTTSWATEALRVLKPGASMLVMGGTRTYHRMACGVEDAGFLIKDCLAWCYNSGFPKAQDLGKMIDKRAGVEREILGYAERFGREHTNALQGFGKGHIYGEGTIGAKIPITEPSSDLAKKWDGWKVGGLKPAYEPILWAVKPPEGAYIDNVLKYGVGAVNVDGCRLPFNGDRNSVREIKHVNREWGGLKNPFIGGSEQGRYPANMIRTDRFHDGYDRFYFIPKAGREERWFKCRVCAVCQDGTHLGDHDSHALHCHECGVDFPNTEEGREAHKNHRTESNIIAHPTVKPVSLGEHLIKLVTREGQIVADFFCGLGSFSVAARRQNRHYIGFDNNPDYIEIARHRLAAIPKPLEVFA